MTRYIHTSYKYDNMYMMVGFTDSHLVPILYTVKGMCMEVVFYLIGPLMLICGIITFIQRRRFVKESSVINGEVVGIRTLPARNNRKAYYPVIGYFDTKTSNQETYESNTAYEASRYKIGDKVELRYLNDGTKKKACMNNWTGIWGLSFMLVLFGLIFCTIEYLLLFVRK